MEKKIATAVEVLIKVAQYENIRVTKYNEAQISYETQEEMIQKEDELNSAVTEDLIRGMTDVADKLRKRNVSIEKVKENISKRIPEWLQNGPEPNIANVAKRDFEKSEAAAHAEMLEKGKEESESDKELETLFGDGSGSSDKVEESKAEEPKAEGVAEEEKKSLEKEDLFDDDDDLFA